MLLKIVFSEMVGSIGANRRMCERFGLAFPDGSGRV